jgi:hypothetical protein
MGEKGAGGGGRRAEEESERGAHERAGNVGNATRKKKSGDQTHTP